MLTDVLPWIPTSLFAVISGTSNDLAVWAALIAVGAWSLVPAGAGLVVVHCRDVV